MSAEETSADVNDDGWDVVDTEKKRSSSKKGDRPSYEYVNIEEGKPKRLRLIKAPHSFRRWYSPIRAVSPGKKDDVCWQNSGKFPSQRYIIFCFDRDDENKIKLYEGGPQVFNKFKEYKELSGGKNPGGDSAPDWLISKKVPMKIEEGRKIKDKRSTEYHVMRDELTPLTDEENERIKKECVPLKDVKKPHTKEQIAEMFEDAKVKQPGDPVPGSSPWWQARRESNRAKNEAQGNSDGITIPTNSEETDTIQDGFKSLFPEEGSGEGGGGSGGQAQDF